MKHVSVSLTLLLVSLLLGGCNIMGNQDKENEQVKPDTPAFQDEFTREFMKSTEEVEDGYYEFESRTGGYTMLFPVTGKMYEGRYYLVGDSGEDVSFEFGENDDNIFVAVDTEYGTNREVDDQQVDTWHGGNLHVVSSHVNYEGEYEKIESDGKTIYHAKNENLVRDEEYENDEGTTFYRFFSYIKDNEHPQGLRFLYEVSCRDLDKPCDIDLDFEEERAKKLMKAVQFHQNPDGSEE